MTEPAVFSLRLSEPHIRIAIAALVELPYKVSAPVIEAIQGEVMKSHLERQASQAAPALPEIEKPSATVRQLHQRQPLTVLGELPV